MEPRLAGVTQRLQSIPGAPVPPEEIAERIQLLYKRLKGTMTPAERAAWAGPQTGGGTLPRDLATLATTQLFSPQGAFPEMKGGASFLEGLAEKAAKGAADGPMGALGQAAPGVAALASGGLSAFPRVKAPTLESFLESQGIPQIPVAAKKVPGDFLGNAARWWVKAASSPYLGALVKLTFFFMFFLSFLESTPLVGSVLSVVLDMILAGGRVVAKALQAGVPALVGLIPLPYAQLGGTALVSVVGLFVWTLLALISFGRQDFTSAIETALRVIPPPLGNSFADAFLDINRTVDLFNNKRIKLMDDIWTGFSFIQHLLSQAGQYVGDVAKGAIDRIQTGLGMLTGAMQQLPEPVPPPFVPGTSPFEAAQPAQVPTAMPLPEGTPGAEMAPVATPVQVPTAQEATIQQALGLPPLAPPEPTLKSPVPEGLPPPDGLPPTAPPVESLPPTAPPVEAPPLEVGPPPQMSPLERLRSGQSVNRDLNVGRGFRGGKPLSAKRRSQRKWTSQQTLYERFFGAGLR